MKLVGGASYGEGTVLLYDDVFGQWTGFCAANFTVADAQVVCRQLGLRGGSLIGTCCTYSLSSGYFAYPCYVIVQVSLTHAFDRVHVDSFLYYDNIQLSQYILHLSFKYYCY